MKVQKETKSKIPLGLKYGLKYCFDRPQKWFQQNERNQLQSIS